MANKSKDASFLAGQQIREFLENIPRQEPTSEWEGSKGHTPPIPPLFGWWVSRMRLEGKISEKVYRYYLNLGRGDSTRTPGQLGQKSLLEGILKKDALSQNAASSASGWRPGKVLGIGGYGEVILWEKKLRDGTVYSFTMRCGVNAYQEIDNQASHQRFKCRKHILQRL